MSHYERKKLLAHFYSGISSERPFFFLRGSFLYRFEPLKPHWHSRYWHLFVSSSPIAVLVVVVTSIRRAMSAALLHHRLPAPVEPQ